MSSKEAFLTWTFAMSCFGILYTAITFAPIIFPENPATGHCNDVKVKDYADHAAVPIKK